MLLFHSTHMAVPLKSFFCNFLGRLHHYCCHSNVFISDFIPPCHSAHPFQHPHLIYFLSLLPRSLHHTTELVWPPFCKHTPSASRASSCHTTPHCISSSFPMLHSLSVNFLLSCLLSPPRLHRDT